MNIYQTSYNSFYQHPQSPTPQTSQSNRGREHDQNAMRRSCLSASPKYEASYSRYAHSTPFLNGQKNDNFSNPNLFSSQVFYDHNYGYVNDMPNNRLLSPVKNDRYAKRNVDIQPVQSSRDAEIPQRRRNRPETEEDNYNSTQNLAPRGRDNRNQRKTSEEEADQNSLRRCLSASPRNGASYSRYAHSAPFSKGRRNDRFANPNFYSSQVFYDHEYGYVNDMPNDRLLSPVKNDRYRKDNQDEITSDRQDIEVQTPPKKKVTIRENTEEVRDDRSEASSTYSGMVCPKCLNRHLAGCKQAACAFGKRQDRELEQRNAEINQRIHDEEDFRRWNEKSKRIQENRELKEQLDDKYYAKLESRRSPARETNTSLNGLFNKHDAKNQKRWELSQLYGSDLKEQIYHREQDKYRERSQNSQFYNTSLQIGQRRYNKYLDDPAAVTSYVKSQIEERAYNKRAEREVEKREEQVAQEQSLRCQEEADIRRKEQEWDQKRDLQRAYKNDLDNKRRQKEEVMMNKSAEKFMIDQGQERFKQRQQEEEYRTRSMLFDYKQSLLDQQQKSSYRKQYEERKQQKTGTSLALGARYNKLYPCRDCNTPYDKSYLTKL